VAFTFGSVSEDSFVPYMSHPYIQSLMWLVFSGAVDVRICGKIFD